MPSSKVAYEALIFFSNLVACISQRREQLRFLVTTLEILKSVTAEVIDKNHNFTSAQIIDALNFINETIQTGKYLGLDTELA